MKTVALIQARMSSSRLPGKVLQEIGGHPMLLRVIRRAQQTSSVELVAVITSTGADDDAIQRLCQENGVPCFRGSLDDVLDRYYQAAKHFQADAVIRNNVVADAIGYSSTLEKPLFCAWGIYLDSFARMAAAIRQATGTARPTIHTMPEVNIAVSRSLKSDNRAAVSAAPNATKRLASRRLPESA